MTNAVSILEAKDISVRRSGSLILDVPSFAVNRGETISLIGPNGAGKTTLLQVLSRLIKFSRGEILFKGEKVGSNRSVIEYRRKLAMVFQEPLLFDATVFENVAAGLRIRGRKGPEIRDIAAKQMARFGITHLEERSARTLSGGEAQRTSLARAFATEPEVLFLDEPFSSLDPPTRESVIDDLERVLRETGTTTVMATHDQIEALRLSDRMAVMMDGRVAQIGNSGDVMNHPANEEVAAFVGMETILEGRVVRRNAGTVAISVGGREIEVAGDARPGEDATVCVRPENVTLSAGSRCDATSARNIFPAKILRILPAGHFYKIQLDCGFPLVAFVTRSALEDLSLREGSSVLSSFKATAVHLIRRREARL